MKKLINQPEDFVDDTLEGIYAAYGDQLQPWKDDKRIVLSCGRVPDGKVGVVTAGGSGHLPLFLGYVGKGMLDGCTVGNVFASPPASRMAEMIRACDRGRGVLCLFGNYGGDRLNFQMACSMVKAQYGTQTGILRVNDDTASAPADRKDKRRGVAGLIYAYKIAGAASWKGADLDETIRVAQHALSNIRSMGVALTPCIVPDVGKPTFSIGQDEMEIGMGIHGEPGIRTSKLRTADETAELILNQLLKEIQLNPGDEVSVMVNGLGGTPLEEQLIVYRRIHQLLGEKEVRIVLPHIGEYATSMEMAGVSVTLMKLDETLKELLRYPARTPFYSMDGEVGEKI